MNCIKPNLPENDIIQYIRYFVPKCIDNHSWWLNCEYKIERKRLKYEYIPK